MLRHATSGKILIALLGKSETARKELSARTGVSSQALSWQMSHLEKAGFVTRTLEESTVKYSLADAVQVAVSKYAILQKP
jgi:DNA-binding HxlR family transcriptional regulator